LAEQVPSDGGHFERSAGYHLVVLKDLLEIALWLRRNDEAPVWLEDALRRMLDYLVAILPPSGRVPLLKDTAWDDAPNPFDLLAAGALYFNEPGYKRSKAFGLYPLLLFGLDGWQKFQQWPVNDAPRDSTALAASGYYVMRDDAKGDHLILDIGKPCPDYLPGHAHADLLSYELAVEGRQIVVDSGVYEYTGGPWRDYFRSTRAHNTVEVNGADQSEVWGSFRVARRARPGRVVWRDEAAHVLAQGEHDGYRRLSLPVTHRRTVVWQKDEFWLVVDELLDGDSAGKMIRAANHVHFHPDVTLSAMGDAAWQIQRDDLSLYLTAFGQQGHSLIRGQREPERQGWYSECFGQLQSNTVLSLHQETALPFCCGYVIAKRSPVQVELMAAPDGQRIHLVHGQREYALRITQDAAHYSG